MSKSHRVALPEQFHVPLGRRHVNGVPLPIPVKKSVTTLTSTVYKPEIFVPTADEDHRTASSEVSRSRGIKYNESESWFCTVLHMSSLYFFGSTANSTK